MAEAVLRLHGQRLAGCRQVIVAPGDDEWGIGLAHQPLLRHVPGGDVSEHAELVHSQGARCIPADIPAVLDALAPEIADIRVTSGFDRRDGHVRAFVHQNRHRRRVGTVQQQGRRVPDRNAVAGQVQVRLVEGGVVVAVDIVGDLFVGADAVGPAEHRLPVGVVELGVAVGLQGEVPIVGFVPEAPHHHAGVVVVPLHHILEQREPLPGELGALAAPELREVDRVLVEDVDAVAVAGVEDLLGHILVPYVVGVEVAHHPGVVHAPDATELDFLAVDEELVAAALELAEADVALQRLDRAAAPVHQAERQFVEVGMLGVPLERVLHFELILELVHALWQAEGGGRGGDLPAVGAGQRHAHGPLGALREREPQPQGRIPVGGVQVGMQAHPAEMGLRHGVQVDVAVDVGGEADEGRETGAALVQPQRHARFLSRSHEVCDVRRPGGVGAPVVPDVAAVDPEGSGVRRAGEAQDDALALEALRNLHGTPEADHGVGRAGGPDRIDEGERLETGGLGSR